MPSTADTYLRDGQFDVDRMLAVFERLASGNGPHAFPRSRIVCRMDWAAGSRSLIDAVIEFESRVNALWPRRTGMRSASMRTSSVGLSSAMTTRIAFDPASIAPDSYTRSTGA